LLTATQPQPITPSVALLDVDPDLGRLLRPDRYADARRALVARRSRLPAGPWDGAHPGPGGDDDAGLLVLDGLIAREVAMTDTVSCHLLGPGDLILRRRYGDPGQLLRAEPRWAVLAPATVAVLDRRVGIALCAFPEVNAMVADRLAEQMDRMAIGQAIGQLNGVERRLLALLWQLAERWGRVAPQGILVPLALTHGVLGALVGARRPTVSTALGRLMRQDQIQRQDDGTWLLTGEPVGQPVGEAARVVRRRARRSAPSVPRLVPRPAAAAR
jgi:hypothetical protein